MNIRQVAVKYLSMSSKSQQQVRDYLLRREFSEKEIDDTIFFLKDLQYIDDRRFAESTFRAEYQKGRGKMRIVNSLKTKGVSKDDIEKGYYDFLDEEGEQAPDEKAIALKEAQRIAEGNSVDQKLKSKIARRLSTKGFDAGIIYYVLNAIGKNGYKEDDD